MKIAIAAPMDIRALARFMGRDDQEIAPGMGNNPATTPLVMELVRRGHEVTLYTLSDQLDKEAMYDWGSLRVFAGPNRRFRYLYLPQIAYLKRVIQADAPRFVHANWTYEFALGALASGAPTVITIHDLPWKVLRFFSTSVSVYVRLLMSYLVVLRGKHFTAVSPDAVRHFRRWFVRAAPIEMIPNFTADWIFDLGRAGAPKSDRPFTFVTVLQGWSRRKNGDCALKAFQIVRKLFPDARMIMIGGGYQAGGEADRWATQQGLTDGVTFQGPMRYPDSLRFVAHEADVLVHPSRDEALSLTVGEAKALKKPVIAGKFTSGMNLLLDEGRVGLLVDVRSHEEVARAMQLLAGDPALRGSLADAAVEHAWKNFRADVVVPKYESLYRRFSKGAEIN